MQYSCAFIRLKRSFDVHSKKYFKSFFWLFITAFVIRGAGFYFYVQHNERYRQPDSFDYHFAGLSLALDKGMFHLDRPKPIFWRTPAYPWYLSRFYKSHGINGQKWWTLQANEPAIKQALWLQIFLCSFIPLILFSLTQLLTHSATLAWITAWLSVFHIGLTFSSMHLLTEGLAMIFFYLFFIFFYKGFCVRGQTDKKNTWLHNFIYAALCLGAATWIRPMGEFVSLVVILVIALFGGHSWQKKIKQVALFLLVFFVSISPWYVRNYNLTGQWFYCPMLGLYLNTFNAPKIIRRTHNLKLEDAIKITYARAQENGKQEISKLRAQGKTVVGEKIHLQPALDILKEHPWWALQDWTQESLKTLFDLHAHQFVDLSNNSFAFDPVEEFLSHKIKSCLWQQKDQQSMPLLMRLLCWLEFIFALLKWIGLLAGAWLFLLQPLFTRKKIDAWIQKTHYLWLKTVPFIGALVFMTGGFGYARLRLPIDPLMIILSLTFWYWLFCKKGK